MSNKNWIIAFLYMLSTLTANTQSLDYDIHSRTIEEQNAIDDFGEKLVQLALDHYPDYATAQESVLLAQEQEKLAKYAWLDHITISGNLNESAIDPPSSDVIQNVYYPRYNFGVLVPLGIIVRQPTQTKIAHRNYRMSLYNIEKIALALRKDVLLAYNKYLLSKDIYELKVQSTEEARGMLATKEEKFANGEISLDEYNTITRAYKLDIEKQLSARMAVENAKLELEMWIGMDLEDVK